MRNVEHTRGTGSRRAIAALLAAALTLVCVLFALAGNAPAQSSAIDDIQGKMDELTHLQAEEGPLRTEIDSQNAEVNSLIGRESALRQQESAAQSQVDAEQQKLNQATAALTAERTKLQQTRAQLQRALAQLRNLLINVYENGTPDTLSVVLNSANWSDVLSQSDYLDRIQNYNDTVAGRVKSLRDQIQTAVVQLRTSRDEIRKARNAVAAQRNRLRAAREQVQSQHDALVKARQARQGTLNALLTRERSLEKSIVPSSVPPGGSAVLLPDGDAVPPANAPLAVKAVIEAANQINDLPYIWGGGHGSFDSPGYDCSGAVSFALHGGGLLSSPLDSTGFEAWGLPGGGSWITVYANSGHAWAVIAGLRWDTAGNAGGSGPRWSTTVTDPGGIGAFIARHPPGL